MTIAFVVNIVGLAFATIAAFLMFYFPPVVEFYTDKGEPIVQWVGNSSEAGKNIGKRRHRLSKLSIFFLALGFLLQLASVLMPTSSNSSYFKCRGEVTIIVNTLNPTMENEEVAVSITGNRISFSGSRYFGGENILICPPGYISASTDQPYFDSDSCRGAIGANITKRTYGTFNKITGKLQLSEEIRRDGITYVRGSFNCSRAVPLLK